MALTTTTVPAPAIDMDAVADSTPLLHHYLYLVALWKQSPGGTLNHDHHDGKASLTRKGIGA